MKLYRVAVVFDATIDKFNHDGTIDVISVQDGRLFSSIYSSHIISHKDRNGKARQMSLEYDSTSSEKRNSSEKVASMHKYWGPMVEVATLSNGVNKPRWELGRVTGEDSHGRFEISFEDSGRTELVSGDCIRLHRVYDTSLASKSLHSSDSLPEPQSPRQEPFGFERYSALSKGEFAEGNFQGRGKWFPCRVCLVRTDDSFDLEYVDGFIETNVSRGRIRTPGDDALFSPINPHSAGRMERDQHQYSSLKNDDKSRFLMGDKVELYNRRKSLWCPGVVIAVHPGGKLYDIQFDDDGHIQMSVHREDIHAYSTPAYISVSQRGSANRSRSHAPMQHIHVNQFRGPIVEARLGTDEWRKGRVTGETNDGRFEVAFGSQEVDLVNKSSIRMVQAKDSANITSPSRCSGESIMQEPAVRSQETRGRIVNVGDKVNVDYGRSDGKLFPGKVMLAHADGSCDVLFEDGETESRVNEKRIHLVESVRGLQTGNFGISKILLKQSTTASPRSAYTGVSFPGQIVDRDDTRSKSSRQATKRFQGRVISRNKSPAHQRSQFGPNLRVDEEPQNNQIDDNRFETGDQAALHVTIDEGCEAAAHGESIRA